MEPFTLDRNFQKQSIIDGFTSLIWTERYSGDSEVEMVVPATSSMIAMLPKGVFLGIDESDEIMILETVNIEEGKLKLKGISLLSWMDNRFIRVSPVHEDKYWYISGGTAGWTLWVIINYMCCYGSPYLNGTFDMGIPNPERFVVPGLGFGDYDKSGPNIEVAVPYGPVYKAMKEIANTYQLGMQITLDSVTDNSYFLGFRSYKGVDRTTEQTEYPPVRFSPQLDSLTDVKELDSIAALKTLVYSFAPGLKAEEGQPSLTTIPGVSSLPGTQYTGFDLRASLLFADDISTDKVGGDTQTVVNILNSRAHDELIKNQAVRAVDGQIVPENQFHYKVDYNLGDVIEIQGSSGMVQPSRITEYIRSQDEAGLKTYPTVAVLT
jgi:hypothetical protein